MAGVRSAIVTPKDKTKSNPLGKQKVSTFSNTVLSL